MGRIRRTGVPQGRRGRLRAALALWAALMAAVLVMAGSVPARAADDRDTVQNSRSQAAGRVTQLRADLEGIDAQLAKVYLQLDDLRQRIPVAQNELASARVALDKATREHEVVLGQLEAAQGERDRIAAAVAASQREQDRATAAIASLARQMYRGDASSPVMIAMTAGGTEDISDRAAAAQALTRSQSRTLDDARTSEVTQRNAGERSKAVTERIQTLETKAKVAEVNAQAAREKSETRVRELASLKKEADAANSRWSAKKAEAQRQLDKWQAEYEAMGSKLARIDAANQATGTSFGGDGAFHSPLGIPLVVTSPFGYRLHPVLGVYKLHNGTDYAAPCGTPVHPIAPGVVVATTREAAGGNVVYVNHGMVGGASWVSAYVHLERFAVSPGQGVSTSSVVGYVGATGYATGCHLHLTMERNGALVDPVKFL